MKLILLALFPIFLNAQQLQPVTSVQPDCAKFSSPIRIAGTVTMATVDNRQAGCDGWVVTYSSNGFATVSVLLQSAPLGTGGIAGTFVSFAGTIVSPFTNPATAITQGEIRATGYYPYVNVAITTTGTGYLVAEFHGYKTNPNSGTGGGGGGSGCVGTSVTPCVVDGPTAAGSAPTKPPVMVAGQDGIPIIRTLRTNSAGASNLAAGAAPDLGDGVSFSTFSGLQVVDNVGNMTNTAFAVLPYVFNGGSWNRPLACTNRANITLTTVGLTLAIPAVAFSTIHICQLSLSFASPVDIQVVEGTQAVTACDTGASNMTGVFRSVTGFDLNWGSNSSLTATNFSDAVCIRMSASVNGGGVATYAQFF
jgi:hypothetical protein